MFEDINLILKEEFRVYKVPLTANVLVDKVSAEASSFHSKDHSCTVRLLILF